MEKRGRARSGYQYYGRGVRIVKIVEPHIVKTDAANFCSVVQSLTGLHSSSSSSSSSSSCFFSSAAPISTTDISWTASVYLKQQAGRSRVQERPGGELHHEADTILSELLDPYHLTLFPALTGHH